MQQLRRGQKLKLPELTPSQQFCVGMWAVAPELTFDCSCFGVDATGQLSDERYFVFFNQRVAPNDSLRLTGAKDGDNETFTVNLTRLPATVQKLVFVLTIDGEGAMAQLTRGHVRLIDGDQELARFAFSGSDFENEKAIIALEIYRKDVWRVAAVGQGFRGGLSAVLKHFGGEEAEEAPPQSTLPLASQNTTLPAPPLSLPSSIVSDVPRNAWDDLSDRTRSSHTAGGKQCARCGKSVGFFESRISFSNETGRCGQCEKEVKAALERFRTDFIAAGADGVLSSDEWNRMWQSFDAARQKIPPSQVLQYVRGDALKFMEKVLAMAAADGIITPDEEQYVHQMVRALEIPAELCASVFQRLEHLKSVSRIREGHLPVTQDSAHHLDAGEVCHLETAATFCKVNSRSVNQIVGRLIVTNKKLHFLSSTGGWTILYKNIMRVEEEPNAVYLELSTRNGNGRYLVKDPLTTEAIITTLTKMAKRQMLGARDDRESRHIPQEIKNAVWQRDGGRCVQCKEASYLEYDHIIPHSKGGASTLNNVQLLCRKCNLSKGDRI